MSGGGLGAKLYRHIQADDAKVAALEVEVKSLGTALGLDDEVLGFLSSCNGEHYNVLFVGNSITRHGLADYWWSEERGLAASENEKDYAHLTAAALSTDLNELKPQATAGVNWYATNYYVWEAQSADRAETYPTLDKFFAAGDQLDVVVVQLGENVNDTATFESDYAALLAHIAQEAPNAKIVMVGDFWKDTAKDEIKRTVTERAGAAYVDLAEIQNQPEYQAGLGTQVLGDDGEWHTIEHAGVATHPGDAGMKFIADGAVAAIRGE